ncbi:MAG: choice-of-anchor J domain-containing protein, partial [Bacteroidota bacterium]
MKKALISILILFSFIVIQAQNKTILLEEGFENGLPTTWNYYQYANPNIPWSTDNFAHSGQFCAIHDFNGSNNSDDWMVTPQLSITENGTNLSFWENIGFLDDYVLHEV